MTTQLRTDDNNLAGAISFKGTDNIALKTSGPELLGVPKAPTAAPGTNTTQVATTGFVAAAVAAIEGSTAVPSTVAPLPDAPTAVVGVSNAYARGDHVHPQFTKAATTTPAQTTPTGAVGVSSDFARADHAHPAGAQSLGTTGYVTVPGGLILQWGFGTFANGGSAIAFPVTFPSAVYTVMATPASTSGNETCAVSGQTQSGFTGRSTNGVGCFWMAMGK